MKKLLAIVLMLALAGGVAWWQWGRTRSPRAGYLTLEWGGSVRGKGQWPAELYWCPVTHVGTLEAISNDSGLVARSTRAIPSSPVATRDDGDGCGAAGDAVPARWVTAS